MPRMLWLMVVGAGAASAVLTRLVMTIASLTRFVDQPGTEAHKQHRRAVPYGGGVAMAIAIAVAVPLAWMQLSPADRADSAFLAGGAPLVIALGAAAMFALGLVDDLRPLGA